MGKHAEEKEMPRVCWTTLCRRRSAWCLPVVAKLAKASGHRKQAGGQKSCTVHGEKPRRKNGRGEKCEKGERISVYSFRPKMSWKIVFTKHCSSHFFQGSISPFHYPILLRSFRSEKVMANSIFTTKCIKIKIFKFFSIITSNALNRIIFFILNNFAKKSKQIQSFIL